MPPVLTSSTVMASSTLWLRPRGEGGGGTRPSCRRCSPPPSPSTCGDGGGGGGGRADPAPDAGGSAVVPPPFPCGGSGEGTYVGGRAGRASAADALPSWRRRTGRRRRTAIRLPPSPRCLSVLSSAASQPFPSQLSTSPLYAEHHDRRRRGRRIP
uniref:Uncharacterized protein n=1 Tax=Oryza glaberrima TaxID=4538 RepID=I1QSL4_ORYGL